MSEFFIFKNFREYYSPYYNKIENKKMNIVIKTTRSLNFINYLHGFNYYSHSPFSFVVSFLLIDPVPLIL